MKNVFAKASEQTKVEIAAQLVIMDAIERGLTTTEQAVQYIKSDVFMQSLTRYLELIK